jgi:hypothetical protein
MFRYKNKKDQNKAQTIIEYTFLMGVIFAIGMAMTPMVKRTSQAMVKMISDQIGAQEDAEQIGGKMGIVVNATVDTRVSETKSKEEDMGETTYTVMRGQVSVSETHSNLGFAEKQMH